jgi:two-component system NtrC family sensor kinase
MAEETVLIVDDRRENIVHLANNILKPNGYHVITAMDGQRGLKSILNDRPDLVILDLNMPKMDGLEVLAALQEREVETPVILTTFYGSEQVAEQALRLGAVNYIVKPYKVTDMLHAVEKALADRPPPVTRPEPEELEEPAEPEAVIPLTRQVERWMRDMNILTRVGKALVAQLDVRRVCKRTVEAALYITRADQAFLLLLNAGEEAKLCLCATRGPQDREVRLIEETVESQLALQVARSGQALVMADAGGEEALGNIIGHPAGPLAATPLRWQQETFGVLIATRDPGEPLFREPDLEWLSGLSEYAAIAVRNAHIHHQSCQPKGTPGHDPQGIATVQRELDGLTAELQTISARLEHLATQLAGEDQGRAQ